VPRTLVLAYFVRHTTKLRPPRQRLSRVPGMFNSLEVQVLYPT
jgi:hypothetical protein